MKPIKLLFLFCLLGLSAALKTQAAYTEEYRPQYHFSASSGWIGDPDGLIRYNNIYHLFWWGHAISSDLVYWSQLPYPMNGGDGSFTYFSGSVAVDKQNTSGFGSIAKPPMVAIYTANNNSSGLQTQCLSSSTNAAYFYYYAGNPVLNLNSTSFRDPDVFWNAQTGQWIMAVALSSQHIIQFYASQNLIAWQYLSTFGPAGARDADWEDPGLFQLPANGDTQNTKWVLTVNKGPNKVQYFVGNFDGTNFVMDALTQSFLTNGIGLDGNVFADFEGANYGNWTTTGTAFGSGPAQGTLPAQNPVNGYLGHGLVNSYNGGDTSTGTLTSPAFTITNHCINFLIGGGNNPGLTCINLLVNGTVVQTATGNNDETLRWSGWNVSQWIGQTAQIQIVDNSTGGWGHIDVDQIIFSDVLMNFNLEQANWVDWGSDFYAARVYRDYDGVEPCAIWLGWMDNWQYANNLPESWGQGAESIPRNLGLVSSPRGYQLVQQPLSRLQKLRGALVSVGPCTIQNTMNLSQFQPSANTYELDAVFNLSATNQNFGLNLCVGGANKVVVGYDAATANVFLDRRASGNVSFSSSFPNIVTAPLLTHTGYIEFHIFVDQSSIEVFVNGGQAVLTSLIFPDPSSLGLQLFSANGVTTLQSLSTWNLASIWH
ncbi:MAG TPA: GH32 C-terminal domain-containing protein [Verrucomicrobiae bacterium]|nr:GH32 C-terminal domain-containing protein [Verrucomicrobiae bacterium]